MEYAPENFPTTTSFFRNQPLLDALGDFVVGLLDVGISPDIHVFAESTGQETWSLLLDFERRSIANKINLAASDFLEENVATASRGFYKSVAGIPPDILANAIDRVNGGFQISSRFRDRVSHQCIDLRSTRLASPVHVALFNNALIHMPARDQEAALNNLRKSQEKLSGQGLLCIGGMLQEPLLPLLKQLGYRVSANTRQAEIFEAWSSQRRAWRPDNPLYWTLPPYDPGNPENFATLFVLD